MTRKSVRKPTYFRTGIDTDILLEEIIGDIGTHRQYDKEISKIMTALLIRNLLEKKIKSAITVPRGRTSMSKLAYLYQSKNGQDDLILFYRKNKAMVNEFAHLESGIDALLTYDIEYIAEQLTILRSL